MGICAHVCLVFYIMTARSSHEIRYYHEGVVTFRTTLYVATCRVSTHWGTYLVVYIT